MAENRRTDPIGDKIDTQTGNNSSNDKDNEAESGMDRAKTNVESVYPPRTNDKPDEKTKSSHEWIRTTLAFSAFCVSIGALFVSSDSRDAAKRSAAAAERSVAVARENVATAKAALEANQRAYVSLGKADGTVAKYIPPSKGKNKGTISLYFQNTGPGPAVNFMVNAVRRLPKGHPLLTEQSKKERHIVRWQYWFKGKPFGKGFTPGFTMAASSTQEIPLDAMWTPTVKEWELINTGKVQDSLSISGNLEYCDRWGKYHCELFDINYKPSPVGFFTATSMQCPEGFPFLPDPKDLTRGDDYSATPLPPCEQPEERKADDQQKNEQ